VLRDRRPGLLIQAAGRTRRSSSAPKPCVALVQGPADQKSSCSKAQRQDALQRSRATRGAGPRLSAHLDRAPQMQVLTSKLLRMRLHRHVRFERHLSRPWPVASLGRDCCMWQPLHHHIPTRRQTLSNKPIRDQRIKTNEDPQSSSNGSVKRCTSRSAQPQAHVRPPPPLVICHISQPQSVLHRNACSTAPFAFHVSFWL
jgi:hypothetical protein